jgi:hypothetical protein
MADVLEQLGERLTELLRDGQRWCGQAKDGLWLPPGVYGWLTSAGHLVDTMTSGRGVYSRQSEGILGSASKGGSVTVHAVERMLGLLQALHTDWSKGLLREVEYLIVAETFDGFLDQAETYHRGGKKVEAGILVSAVFEDGIRKLAKKHAHDHTKPVEALIDDLVGGGKITPIAGKRLKVPAGLRNKALHAKWEEFDLQDIGAAVKTTRELVDLING